MKDIKNMLLDVGVDAHSKGLLYWYEAALLIKDEEYNYKMENIYIMLGKKYYENYRNIERVMRFSINSSKDKIKKYFNYQGKITNKVFLNLIKFELS